MDKVQPVIAQLAAVLRGVLEQVSPQIAAMANNLPDLAVVGGVAAAAILAVIILLTLINMIGALFRPKSKKKAKAREQDVPVQRAAVRPTPPPQAAPRPQPAPPQRAPDPVQKIQRDAESGVARVKQDAERLVEALLAERERAVKAGANFGIEAPARAFQLLAQTLTASDAPALGAARRRIASGDFDGARADLRRHAEETKGQDGAWRNLAALECMHDLAATFAALEQARAVDGKDFVSLVMLRRLYSGVGQAEPAHDAALAALAAARDDRERAIGLDELGIACMQREDVDGARKALTESLELVERLAARAPDDAERQRDVAVGNYKLAALNGPDSRERLIAAITVFDRLSKANKLSPADIEAMGQLKAILADMDKEGAEKK